MTNIFIRPHIYLEPSFIFQLTPIGILGLCCLASISELYTKCTLIICISNTYIIMLVSLILYLFYRINYINQKANILKVSNPLLNRIFWRSTLIFVVYLIPLCAFSISGFINGGLYQGLWSIVGLSLGWLFGLIIFGYLRKCYKFFKKGNFTSIDGLNIVHIIITFLLIYLTEVYFDGEFARILGMERFTQFALLIYGSWLALEIFSHWSIVSSQKMIERYLSN